MREALAAAFQCRYRPMALMMIAWSWVLAAPASGDEVREVDGHRHHSAKHDERGYGAHAEPRIEVIVGGVTNGEPARQKAKSDADEEASICRQAHSVTWSTRNLPCPDAQPAERSKVWSTTGN